MARPLPRPPRWRPTVALMARNHGERDRLVLERINGCAVRLATAGASTADAVPQVVETATQTFTVGAGRTRHTVTRVRRDLIAREAERFATEAAQARVPWAADAHRLLVAALDSLG